MLGLSGLQGPFSELQDCGTCVVSHLSGALRPWWPAKALVCLLSAEPSAWGEGRAISLNSEKTFGFKQTSILLCLSFLIVQ